MPSSQPDIFGQFKYVQSRGTGLQNALKDIQVSILHCKSNPWAGREWGREGVFHLS